MLLSCCLELTSTHVHLLHLCKDELFKFNSALKHLTLIVFALNELTFFLFYQNNCVVHGPL